jgi:hypothetical protein
MHKLIAGLAAGLALLAVAPAALGATVSVRVEGTGDTLLPRTTTTTSAGTFTKDGSAAHSCSRNSAGGALEAATGGNWSGKWLSFGDYQVQTIKGETHAGEAAADTYWAFWLNYQYSQSGACGTPLQDGDEVLFFPGCYGAGCDRDPSPLRITAIPGSAAPGATFDVKVVQYGLSFDTNPNGETTSAPAQGATVSADGRSFTAGADGVAHVTVTSKGVAGVRATKDGYVRSATEPVCVDCGTTTPPPPPGSPGADDTVAPATTLGIKNGKVFSRRKAPRTLRGKVAPDPSGLSGVKIRLLRKTGKKCAFFSGGRERWRRTHLCWHGAYFAIGDRASWSYLLPKRLGSGRYVLQAYAIDGAGNRGPIKRVRFRVR